MTTTTIFKKITYKQWHSLEMKRVFKETPPRHDNHNNNKNLTKIKICNFKSTEHLFYRHKTRFCIKRQKMLRKVAQRHSEMKCTNS